MKCLLKYQWVKLPRSQMPVGKGVMGAWARLASRAGPSVKSCVSDIRQSQV